MLTIMKRINKLFATSPNETPVSRESIKSFGGHMGSYLYYLSLDVN